MRSTLSLMAAEAQQMRPGGEAVITRLGDVLVIQAIRAWIEGDPEAQRGWLGALQDPRIGPAIALIHRHPERAWTLGSLAAEVAMSRSAFAARFTELVGEPAMRYLARWRMHLAATALRDGATVTEVADRFAIAPRPRSAAPSSASSASRPALFVVVERRTPRRR
ncbi:MAG TPA: AraC family transcriptional regulator [Solirubrobacterales bacterium]|nr:AraC family transcriptional regulator [Solirubrobacterales bacterium]